MKIACVCGRWHDVSPTALAVVVHAFIDGDLQTVRPGEITPSCISAAFTPERVTTIRERYGPNVIKFDGEIQIAFRENSQEATQTDAKRETESPSSGIVGTGTGTQSAAA